VQQKVFVSSACRDPSGFQLDRLTALQVDAHFALLTSAFEASPDI
jgi:hypothetical protein